MPEFDIAARRELALQRLLASREQLRRELVMPGDVRSALEEPSKLIRRLRAQWRRLRMGMRSSPLASIALGALQDWWQHHPWRAPSELLVQEVQAAVTPLIRRHPIATTLLAAAAGVFLVTVKPWRWPVISRPIQSLPGRAATWLLAQLGRAPGQALLSALLLILAQRTAATAPATHTTHETPVAPGAPITPTTPAAQQHCQSRPTPEHAER